MVNVSGTINPLPLITPSLKNPTIIYAGYFWQSSADGNVFISLRAHKISLHGQINTCLLLKVVLKITLTAYRDIFIYIKGKSMFK